MPDHDDFDSPWKEILGDYFQEFMAFFFPEIAEEIDWTKEYEALDKELHQITRDADMGSRLADKLLKVWKKNGQETWVLVHVEVQAQEEKGFGHRVYVYNYRIHDLYNRPVVSLAVLADDNPRWHVSSYEQSLWGCVNTLRFPTVKILSYKDRWEFLESSPNRFAIVVMAHLRTMETQKDHESRLRDKLTLSKSLYRRGWTRQEITDLYRFIDWIMRLPEGSEQIYHKELLRFEKEVKMPYVTTAERFGMKEGIKKGVKRGKKEGIIIGEILVGQRVLRQNLYSREMLEAMTLKELERIHSGIEEKLSSILH
jgi:hypothetical protein